MQAKTRWFFRFLCFHVGNLFFCWFMYFCVENLNLRAEFRPCFLDCYSISHQFPWFPVRCCRECRQHVFAKVFFTVRVCYVCCKKDSFFHLVFFEVHGMFAACFREGFFYRVYKKVIDSELGNVLSGELLLEYH